MQMAADVELQEMGPASPPSPSRAGMGQENRTNFRFMSDENENFAILLVNDAIKREEGLYYEGDDGMAHTCWETNEYARKVGLQLRSVAVTNGLSALALLDLVLSAIAVPSMPGFEGMATGASYLQFLIWAVFVVTASIRTYFMWGFRRNWCVRVRVGIESVWRVRHTFASSLLSSEPLETSSM